MKHVDIYTDGACRGNPGRGGWGAILVYGGHEKELSGGEKMTTNNRMELTAAIVALEALKEPCEVTLYSGSKYYALSHENNNISVVQVTVSDGAITSEITEDLVWDYSNKKLSYEDNGTTYYLYAQSNNWWGNLLHLLVQLVRLVSKMEL